MSNSTTDPNISWLRQALNLARRGYGCTSPNPMVGAVLVKGRRIIGRGWHRRAGAPHAEIEALQDARRRGFSPHRATLYVTLEPCCTHGRTPPCTDAIIAAGIRRVVVGAKDPNPEHSGRAFAILRRAGIKVDVVGDSEPRGALSNVAQECARLNEAFNHWIVQHTPFVTVKAAMTLDGKIATTSGESKWITGAQARGIGMELRRGADAILVGVNTILADDPSLTVRWPNKGNVEHPTSNTEHRTSNIEHRTSNIGHPTRGFRRIVLDSRARTPLTARVVRDEQAALTTIVVSRVAPQKRVTALAKRVKVLVAPELKDRQPQSKPQIDLGWLLQKLGADNVTSLLVEGGGEVNASFLLGGLAQRVAFFYAPKIIGGRDSLKAVAGGGADEPSDILQLEDLAWRAVGTDLLLTARVAAGSPRPD